MRGIGYQEFRKYIEGRRTLEKAIEQLKKNTKKYAKRQSTWFKRDNRIKWCKEYSEAEELIDQFLN